ncbi:hypothetical protein [Deinococcus planocerae]|uniref:hypothetical protein n=1 Tax=Deinococcus planocerae TaxID=1737569 RepID=UPI0011AFBA1E|nr:hypothetical protein [Deinococcus planocerae]
MKLTAMLYLAGTLCGAALALMDALQVNRNGEILAYLLVLSALCAVPTRQARGYVVNGTTGLLLHLGFGVVFSVGYILHSLPNVFVSAGTCLLGLALLCTGVALGIGAVNWSLWAPHYQHLEAV